MVCMNYEYGLHGFDDLFVNLENLIHRVAEHHVEEVLHITETLLRIHNWQATGSSVSVSSQCRHFCNHLYCQYLSIKLFFKIVVRMHEGREGTDHSDHNGHWMGRCVETLVKINELFIDHHLANDSLLELLELLFIRQLAINQQIACLHIG